MSNLCKVDFKPEENTNKQLIEILEECLLRAKSGEFCEGLVVLTTQNNKEQSWWRTGLDFLYTVGVLERLKFALLHDQDSMS